MEGTQVCLDGSIYSNDVWMAFHANEDYAKGEAPYSDTYDLVETPRYAMTRDLLEPKKSWVLGKIGFGMPWDGVRVIPFAVGEVLDIFEDEPRKKQLHLFKPMLSYGHRSRSFRDMAGCSFNIVLPRRLHQGDKYGVLESEGVLLKDSRPRIRYTFPEARTWYRARVSEAFQIPHHDSPS